MKRITMQTIGVFALVLYACSPEDGLTDALPRGPLPDNELAQFSPLGLDERTSHQVHETAPEVALDVIILEIDKRVSDLTAAEIDRLASDPDELERFVLYLFRSDVDFAGHSRIAEAYVAKLLTTKNPASVLRQMRSRYKELIPDASLPDRWSRHRGTPCFDKYQADMNEAALAWTECTLTSLGMALPMCSVSYYAKASVLRQKFKNCVTYGIEN